MEARRDEYQRAVHQPAGAKLLDDEADFDRLAEADFVREAGFSHCFEGRWTGPGGLLGGTLQQLFPPSTGLPLFV